MYKYRKAGLLIVLLVVPVFIFLFLKFFGTNHFELPTFHPVKDPSGQARLTNGDTAYYAIQGLQLNDSQSGENLTETVLQEKFTVVSYLPAPCGDSCRKVLTQLARINDMQQSIPELQILTLTEEGRQEERRSLYQEYSLNTDSWRVLTGSEEEVKAAAAEVFRMTENIPAGKQTISLSNRLILIDNQKHIRGYYNALDAEDVARLMAEIKVLEYSTSLKQ
ncbi:SCO family protein [Telluribacter sp.]|jgi:protein SCO1/2|uniref:SCO family protein n=1 Tax=Telluribacter sp. TaxID=1978767 RepID=UPI002E0E1A2F|nr:SCO family protein [Telluribacter sp.]